MGDLKEKFSHVCCEEFRNHAKDHISKCDECKASLQSSFITLVREFPILNFVLKKLGLDLKGIV